MTLCNRRDYARYAHVGVSGSGRWCSHRAVPRNHECCHWCPRHAVPRNHRCCHWCPRHAVPRNHRCCHWRPRHALSPCNHVQSTIMNFPLLVPILNLLSACTNSSSLFPVAVLCTLLHRENTSFEVRYFLVVQVVLVVLVVRVIESTACLSRRVSRSI